MSILIVERIEDAPEKGDCWLFAPNVDDFDIRCYFPVRDLVRGFRVRSAGGWKTHAKHWTVEHDGFEPTELSGRIAFSNASFLPTAEDAIRAYHADPEKCPFGEVRLAIPEDKSWDDERMFATDLGSPLLRFWNRCHTIELECGKHEGLKALHALIGEVIAYQEAVAAGRPEQSAIGRHLAERDHSANAQTNLVSDIVAGPDSTSPKE